MSFDITELNSNSDLITYNLKQSLSDLSLDVSSHRFVFTTLKDLTDKLDIKLDRVSYLNNSCEYYVNLSRFLEKNGLKLVPAFVPVDLDVNDQVMICANPNLNNDEDIAVVTELVKNKKVPGESDKKHITAMTVKLTNYNVMLRVFEALFVISPVQIDPHQATVLNEYINMLTLPKEGLSFLKNCFTYACENRNHHCDYSNSKYCFKPLTGNQNTLFLEILAKTAAVSPYFVKFESTFPFASELTQIYLKFKAEHKKSVEAQKNELINEEKKKKQQKARVAREHLKQPLLHDAADLSSQRTMEELTESYYQYEPLIRDLQDTFDLRSSIEVEKKIFSNNPVTLYARANLSYFGISKPEAILPSVQELKLIDFSDNATCQRSFNSILTLNSSNVLIQKLYSFVPNTTEENKDRFLQETFYRYYLDSNSKRLSKVTEHIRTSVIPSILIFQYYMRLLLVPAFIRYDKDEYENAIAQFLDDTAILEPDNTLYLVRGLAFALFELEDQIKAKALHKVETDLAMNKALCLYPQLCLFIIYQMICVYKLPPQEAFELFKEPFAVILSQDLLYEIQINFNTENNLNCEKLILMIIKNRLNGMKFDDLFRLNHNNLFNDPYKGDSNDLRQSFINFAIPPHTRDYTYSRLSHLPLYAEFFSQLLNPDVLIASTFTDLCPVLSKENFVSIKEALYQHTSDIENLATFDSRYDYLTRFILNELKPYEENELKTNLLSHEFSSHKDLCNLFGFAADPKVNSFIEGILPETGLFVVPAEIALPVSLRFRSKKLRIISTEVSPRIITRKLLNKLYPAQLAYVAFSSEMSLPDTVDNLCDIMKLTDSERRFVKKYLLTLSSISDKFAKLTPVFYKTFYAKFRNTELFITFIAYFKKLCQLGIENNPLKNYFISRFSEIFESLHIREASPHKSAPSSVSENDTKAASGGSFSFLKKRSFNVKELDTRLISQKLDESSQIQDLIGQFRSDNEDDHEVMTESENIVVKEKIIEPIEPSDNSVQSDITFPSEQAKKLILALKAQNSDVIDLDEFKGMCLSLKYMSADAAIEEINEFGYENYDDLILDVAYEENTVYLTEDILNQI